MSRARTIISTAILMSLSQAAFSQQTDPIKQKELEKAFSELNITLMPTADSRGFSSKIENCVISITRYFSRVRVGTMAGDVLDVNPPAPGTMMEIDLSAIDVAATKDANYGRIGIYCIPERTCVYNSQYEYIGYVPGTPYPSVPKARVASTSDSASFLFYSPQVSTDRFISGVSQLAIACGAPVLPF
ncbi:hypothetical protein [Ponticaulis profundi]|uniref:DUF1254 domain-containing protein n=1 Tax=Ponticaulis profundi TaxID=2665222 RepID=A0ABW1SC39_9PROT